MSGLVFDDLARGYPAQYLFKPSASGTVISGPDALGRMFAYTPGQVFMYIDGQKIPAEDFTATDGSTITLVGSSYNSGSVIDIWTVFVMSSPDAISYIADQTTILTAAQQKRARSNMGVNDNNVIINGDFRINQRTYVTNTATAAGVYMHDRWKAGAGGATYTFTQLASSTQITITAGTIIQVVEDKNVEGGGYVLSWSGTAQARAGVNSATPSGAYSASPLIISAQTAGTVMSIEFNTGTLGKVKLETGSTPTPFVASDYQTELIKARRYCKVLRGSSTAAVYSTGFYSDTNTIIMADIGISSTDVPMYALPTIKMVGNQGSDWYVMTSGGVPQTGFAISGGFGTITASKVSHGISPNVSLVLNTVASALIKESEL